MILPEPVLVDLQRRYAEPWRYYHGWSHIASMLARAEGLAPTDPDAFHLAILFHDAVYDPRAQDNERQSASLLHSLLGSLCPAGTPARAEALILTTEKHLLPETDDATLLADAALFLDLDLAVLASAPEAFDTYDAAIRREYAHVPEDTYRVGRRAVLESFLRRESLFFSGILGPGADAVARGNLRRAIDMLAYGERPQNARVRRTLQFR